MITFAKFLWVHFGGRSHLRKKLWIRIQASTENHELSLLFVNIYSVEHVFGYNKPLGSIFIAYCRGMSIEVADVPLRRHSVLSN